MKKTDKTIWCDPGWFPTRYAFVPSEKAWNAEVKRLGANEPYPDSDGRCTTLQNKETGQLACLVTISEKMDGRDPMGVIGLIVHEAVHVFQSLREDIGEDRPSEEFEAYSIQNISLNLIDAYARTRGSIDWGTPSKDSK